MAISRNSFLLCVLLSAYLATSADATLWWWKWKPWFPTYGYHGYKSPTPAPTPYPTPAPTPYPTPAPPHYAAPTPYPASYQYSWLCSSLEKTLRTCIDRLTGSIGYTQALCKCASPLQGAKVRKYCPISFESLLKAADHVCRDNHYH